MSAFAKVLIVIGLPFLMVLIIKWTILALCFVAGLKLGPSDIQMFSFFAVGIGGTVGIYFSGCIIAYELNGGDK